MCVTTTSAWPWIAHLVSGLRPTTQSPCSDSLSLRLPYSVKLAIERKSLTHYAKGTQSPLRAPTVCMYAVSGSISLPSRGSFRLSFNSPPGVLFAFPSQYWFTIGRSRVFSLGGWSPHLRTGFHVSRSTCRSLSTFSAASHKGLSPSMAGLSRPFCCRPEYQLTGSSDFARRYFQNLG